MKCIACDYEYEYDEMGGRCPHCNFPPVEILGDYEEGMRLLELRAAEQRAAYLEDIQVSIVLHYWKDVNGKIEPDREQIVPLATGPELLNGEHFLPQPCSRIENIQNICLNVVIQKGQTLSTHDVRIPNLFQPSLQQIGIRLKNKLFAEFVLKNEFDSTVSAPFLL